MYSASVFSKFDVQILKELRVENSFSCDNLKYVFLTAFRYVNIDPVDWIVDIQLALSNKIMAATSSEESLISVENDDDFGKHGSHGDSSSPDQCDLVRLDADMNDIVVSYL